LVLYELNIKKREREGKKDVERQEGRKKRDVWWRVGGYELVRKSLALQREGLLWLTLRLHTVVIGRILVLYELNLKREGRKEGCGETGGEEKERCVMVGGRVCMEYRNVSQSNPSLRIARDLWTY
jgi:hypothetical protein